MPSRGQVSPRWVERPKRTGKAGFGSIEPGGSSYRFGHLAEKTFPETRDRAFGRTLIQAFPRAPRQSEETRVLLIESVLASGQGGPSFRRSARKGLVTGALRRRSPRPCCTAGARPTAPCRRGPFRGHPNRVCSRHFQSLALRKHARVSLLPSVQRCASRRSGLVNLRLSDNFSSSLGLQAG